MIINRDINQSVQHSKSDPIMAGSRTYISPVYYNSRQPVISPSAQSSSHPRLHLFPFSVERNHIASLLCLLKRRPPLISLWACSTNSCALAACNLNLDSSQAWKAPSKSASISVMRAWRSQTVRDVSRCCLSLARWPQCLPILGGFNV